MKSSEVKSKVGEDKGKGNFRKSFSTAKKSGAKSFSHKGKKYSTQTAEEKARKLSKAGLKKKVNSSYEKVKSNPSKSNVEIANSYVNEKTHRIGDKVQKQGLDVTKYSEWMKTKGVKGSAYGTKRPKRLGGK